MTKNKITPELLQKIKDAVNIIEVVGEHVVLRKSGSNYSGLCPFHSERSPSFSVSEQKQLYHCYGCKKGGDLVSFVMETHAMSFPEAIEDLAERGKVQLPKEWGVNADSPEEDKRRAAAREKQNLFFKLNRFVAAFYHHALSQQPPVQKYFNQRGVPADQIRNFYLGAAPAGWDGLSQHLAAKQAPLEIARELGLIRPSPKSAPSGGSGHFDLFRSRAMFPILDLRGKVVGFGGRSLPDALMDSTKDSEGPKYMNSPESPIFHKSKIAYGLYQAQKHIREKDEVILVEGYFDVIALHTAGFQNVVATCGTALTVDHLNVFRKFASKITVLFDGDRAGVSATERAMELGLSQGVVLYGAALPVDLDPDEVLFSQETGLPLPEGVAQMEAILQSSKPLLDARVADQIQQASQGPEARTQALKQIGQWLSQYKDPVGREVRIQDVESKLGISRQLLERAMGNTGPSGNPNAPSRQPSWQPPGPSFQPQQNRSQSSFGVPMAPQQRPRPLVQKTGASTTQGPSRPSAADKILLQALAHGGKGLQKFREVRQKLPPDVTFADLFDYFPARAFLARFLEDGDFPEGFSLSSAEVSEVDSDPQVRSILMEAWVSGPAKPRGPSDGPDLDPEAEFSGAINRGIARLWARFSQRIKAALQDAEAKKDAGLHARLSKEYLDVQRKMKEFITFYDEA